MEFDKLKEECGIFGVFGITPDAVSKTVLGLHALQHRGQEAAGIVSFDRTKFHIHKEKGLVNKVFNSQLLINKLEGYSSIGHVRYSTMGDNIINNIQPLFADFSFGGFSIAHNGNIVNADELRSKLIKKGHLFQSTSDTETIIHLISISKKPSLISKICDSLNKIKGAYSLVMLVDNKLIGVRDPTGFRPLVLGKLGNSFILSSESCALDIIDAKFIRDIEPGELITIDNNGPISIKPFKKVKQKFCVFEYIYFSRPDSTIEKINVYEVRKHIGAQLSKEANISADMVIPVPDSGVPSAIGYSNESGIPFELGIIRSHYIGRTFIEPTSDIRNLEVKLKHNVNKKLILGKRIILVDDSIVRGTTAKKLIQLIRDAGAKEIHLCISSPPVTHSCFYGIDTPIREELIASFNGTDKISKLLGVDSLTYISIKGLYKAIKKVENITPNLNFCDACFTGKYPIKIPNYKE